MQLRPLLLCTLLAGCPAPTVPPNDGGPSTNADDDDGGPGGPIKIDPSDYDGWTVEPADGGVVKIRYRHAELARMEYFAFGPKWEWAGMKVTDKPKRKSTYPFSIASAKLPISIDGAMKPDGKGGFSISYKVRVGSDLTGIKGIGAQFILRDEAAVWPQPPAPSLTEKPPGFSVPAGDGQALDLTFAGKRTRAFFERGDKFRVRVMFVEGDVAKGTYQVEMKVALPEGGKIMPSVAERYGPEERDTWHEGALEWNDWPVDVSFLNEGHRPAGVHGRVKTVGEDLQFEDGTPARFWGTNVTAQALFIGTNEDIKQQAKRIAALGYNLVRIHHHDVGWIRKNVFESSDGTTQRLDHEALDRIDWWIKCLKDEGIYVWLDLHDGRKFLPGDGIPGFDELQLAQDGEGRGFNYVNPRIESLMERFAKQYLDRRNKYTGTKVSKDPAVLGVLVTNENDLSDHLGVQFLPDKPYPKHRELFEKAAKGVIADIGIAERDAMKLWLPGSPKLLLAEMQHRYGERAKKHLRGLGVKAPMVTTSYWGRDKLFGLATLADGDVVDVHSYGQAEALSTNPRFEANWIHFIATAQLVGKPVTVSEWSVPSPARDRFTAPLYAASIGALQGWDAMMAFNYNMGPTAEPTRTNKWVQLNDPAQLALVPTAALIFRRGDVRRAAKTYVLRPGRGEIWGAARNAENSATIRTLAEQSRIMLELPRVRELPWARTPLGPGGTTVTTSLDRDFTKKGAHSITSDTGEIRRDWVAGVQTIDTPLTQAASGWLGGKEIVLTDVIIEVETQKAAVALTSLDGKPLALSRNILVTAVARSYPKGSGYVSEPVIGRIRLRSESGALGLTPLSSRSRASLTPPSRPPTAAEREGDLQVFSFPADLATHWFLLHPPA